MKKKDNIVKSINNNIRSSVRKLNPILKDRMYRIKTKGYSHNYLMPLN